MVCADDIFKCVTDKDDYKNRLKHIIGANVQDTLEDELVYIKRFYRGDY